MRKKRIKLIYSKETARYNYIIVKISRRYFLLPMWSKEALLSIDSCISIIELGEYSIDHTFNLGNNYIKCNRELHFQCKDINRSNSIPYSLEFSDELSIMELVGGDI